MKPVFSGTVMRTERERGGILIVAVIVILAMLIMAIPFLFKLSGQWRSTERSNHSLAAFNLAEAGVERALYYLDPDTPVLNDPESIVWTHEGVNLVGFMNGVKSAGADVMGDVNILLGPPYGADPERRNLDSTGIVPFIADKPVDRSVRVTLEKYFESAFDYGFFVDISFNIHNSFFMDSYDSRDGSYGGTNALGTDVIFGTNGYDDDGSFVIEAGGGSSELYGQVGAGGTAAGDYQDSISDADPSNDLLPPDAEVLDEVIDVPKETVFQGDESRFLMKEEYQLPSVDVFKLPPKEILGAMPVVGEWFEDYTSADPSAAAYYDDRFVRAPSSGEILDSYEHGPLMIPPGGTGSLTPSSNGIYPALNIGDEHGGATLNVSGGDVAIYVTELSGSSGAGSFFMGPSSSINIASDSSLTLILGNTSFVVAQGYLINQTSGKPADLVILGTDQFALPPTQNPADLPKKLSDLADIPGLMWFEHGQADGYIYSAMYVPRAHVATGQGQNHMNFYGSWLASSMDFKNQVDFHYDEALADLEIITAGPEHWRIIAWQEVVQ